MTIAIKNPITTLRKMETDALKSGGISKKEATDMLAYAKKSGSAEAKAAVKEMFARDAFDSPKLGKKFNGKVDGHASPIAGTKVGNTTVVRTFGAPEGYSNKFQAIAIAREQGGPYMTPMAVVKDSNGKWHAALTKDPLSTTDIKSAFPLKTVDYTARATAIGMPEGTADEKAAKAKALAVASLGVPAELINTGSGTKHFDKEKLNVNVNMTDANGKTHIHDSSCACGKNGAAIELSLGRLKNSPDLIAGTLFHEGQHKADDDVLHGQLEKGKLTGTEKSSKGALEGAAVSKESSAYGRSFLATVDQSKEAALDQLLGYMFNEINEAQTPNKLNTTLRADMVKEMKAHYDTLPEDLKAQFKQVVAVAELYYPKSTLYSELFGKEAKPTVSKSDIATGAKNGMVFGD